MCVNGSMAALMFSTSRSWNVLIMFVTATGIRDSMENLDSSCMCLMNRVFFSCTMLLNS